MAGWLEKRRAFALVLVAVVVVAGAWLLLNRQDEPVEIVVASREDAPGQGSIYLSGAVANPGVYPWRNGDSIADLVSAAGLLETADVTAIKVYVPRMGELSRPQRVNLNTADEWLIAALPGVGDTRARAIIEYRRGKGLFRSPGELTQVTGFGPAAYDKIKDLITVGE